MFDSLSDRLTRTIKNLRGQGRLTDDNIKDTLRDVRMALLEADVALPVVRDFIDRVKDRFQKEVPAKRGVVIAGGGETGYHLAQALEYLQAKRDERPPKKHGLIPL